MAEKLVTNIISKDAFDEVKNLSKEMDILVQKLEQAITNAKNFDAAFKSAKGVIEFEKALYSTVDAQNELIKTGEQLKDNYVKQEAAQKAVISETVSLKKAIKDTDDAVKKINSTLDAGAKVLAEQKIELEKNKKEQKELKKELEAGRITLDQYSEKMVFLIQNEQELKVQTAQLTQAQKQFAKENIAVVGSMDQAGIRIGRLREEYRTLTDEEKASPFGKNLKSAIDALDPAIKSADASIGNFQRNVGDYTNSINKSFKGAFGGAFNVLVTELNEIKQKLQDPALSGKAFESLSKQGVLLEQVLEGISKEFTSTRQESRAFQEAATKLGLAFDINSEQFQKFRTEVGKGVDNIRDIKDSIKLASSDTKGLDRLIGAAQGITGAFSVAQGAAALFGDENEELQKTFVKLQAAMTILNGLQAIQNELKNKDSVFSKAINFLRGQETKLTIAQTEAQAANAVATNAGAAATSRLGLAMKALGIGAVLAVISGLVYVFNKLGESTEEAGRKQKALNDALKEAQPTYAKAIEEVSTLKNEVQLAKDGFISKNEAVKHYNETIGKAAGQVKTLDEVEQSLTKNGDAYIQVMFKKAIATELFKKAAEKAAEAETTSIEDNTNFLDVLEVGIKGFFNSTKDNMIELVKVADKNTEEAKAKLKKDSNDYLKLANDFNTQAAELAKKNKLNFFNDSGENKGNNDAAKKAQDDAKKSAKALFDDLKAEAEERIKVFKAIADNENNNYYLRLVGLENYQKEQKKLIEDEHAYLLNVPKLTAGEIQKINGDARRKLNALEFEAGQERIGIIKKNAADEKVIMEELRKEIDTPNNKRKDIITTNTNDVFLKQAEQNAIAYKLDIQNLNKALQEKSINIQQYNEQKAKIESNYEELSLSNQIENNKALIDNLKGKGIDVSELLKQQADLEMMFSDLTTKHFIENEEKKAAKRKEIQNKSVELFNEVAKLFETAVLAGYDREKNEIQDQINSREEQKTKEIEAVNAEGISAQEKANKIAIINARAQAQKEELERRQRKIDLERAKFERAFNIGQIIAKTAVAVATALPNVILASIIAAIGAVQLATVLAQPLPKFAKGTKDSGKAGFAIVGEDGVEQIETKEGKKFLTPDVPTITYLPAHTKVTPNNELMLQKARETALYNSLKPIEYNVNNSQQQIQIEKLENLMEQTVSAIKSKPVAHITNTWKGVETSYQGVNGWTKYINTYINS